MTTDNFCFCLQNRLIQTSQTGGQWYSDTSPFSIPCKSPQKVFESRERERERERNFKFVHYKNKSVKVAINYFIIVRVTTKSELF